MIAIIGGSRTARRKHVYEALTICPFASEIWRVRSGKQKSWDKKAQEWTGADYWGEHWATANNIPVDGYWPNWNEYGLAAGPIRNRAMITNNGAGPFPNLLVLIWTGDPVTSKGSADMRGQAIGYGIRIDEYVITSSGNIIHKGAT